jgi:hypothetical protein
VGFKRLSCWLRYFDNQFRMPRTRIDRTSSFDFFVPLFANYHFSVASITLVLHLLLVGHRAGQTSRPTKRQFTLSDLPVAATLADLPA